MIDERPRVLLRWKEDPTLNYGFVPGADYLTVGSGGLWLVPWHALDQVQTDLSKGTLVASAQTDPEGLEPTSDWMWGDALFWHPNSLSYQNIMVWDAKLGAHSLLRWLGDRTQGVSNLGTDGRDMVWIYGSGRAPNARVIRDGWSWLLPGVNAQAAWKWSDPIAITCDEVFTTVSNGGGGPIAQIARVKLNSLGAGVAPD